MPFTPFNPKANSTQGNNSGFTAFDPKKGIIPADTNVQQKQTQDLETKLNTSSNYGDKVAGQQLGGAKKIAGSISTGGKNISKGMIEGGAKGAVKIAEGTAQGAFGTITGAAQIALSPITPAVSKAIAWITPALRASNPQIAKAYDAIMPKVNELEKKHPESSTLIGDMVNTALLAVGGGGADLGEAADATKGAITELPGNIKDAAVDVKNSVKSVPKTDVEKIAETAAPKPTIKKAKVAESEGRLVKGQKPGVLTPGKPDTILPTADQTRAYTTIAQKIPGAATMDEPTLYKALDDNITQTATQLKPQMQAVAIKPEIIEKINTDWDAIKQKQMDASLKSDEPDLEKRQQQFEKNFLQTSKSDNLNDLWDSAKKYDRSVPDNVKNATDTSPKSLQDQKAEWLQNRSLFKSAINDSKNGLGKTSQDAFQQMTDMYNTQEDILSKAKIETKGAPSKLSQFSDSPKGKILKGALKVGGGALVVDKVGKALGL